MRLSKARKACVTAMMKDTIFEAASSLLEQHGSGGLTMDRVATKVGLATGSLYNYFQGKDDLLRFFYARLVEPSFLAIQKVADSDLPASQKLEPILRVVMESAVSHKGLIRLLAGIDSNSEVRKDIRPRMLRILMTIFKQGIEDGSFRPHNPMHTSRMFLGCLTELFELQAGGASNEEVQGFAETLIDAAVNGFSIRVEKESKP